MAQEVLDGEVVESVPDSPFPTDPSGGLYLLTDDGRGYALIAESMAAQMPLDALHRQSRKDFEGYLGQKVRVSGYVSGNTIFGAVVND